MFKSKSGLLIQQNVQTVNFSISESINVFSLSDDESHLAPEEVWESKKRLFSGLRSTGRRRGRRRPWARRPRRRRRPRLRRRWQARREVVQTRDDENIGSISKFYFGASAESAERAPPQLLYGGTALYARERAHARMPACERKLTVSNIIITKQNESRYVSENIARIKFKSFVTNRYWQENRHIFTSINFRTRAVFNIKVYIPRKLPWKMEISRKHVRRITQLKKCLENEEKIENNSRITWNNFFFYWIRMRWEINWQKRSIH